MRSNGTLLQTMLTRENTIPLWKSFQALCRARYAELGVVPAIVDVPPAAVLDEITAQGANPAAKQRRQRRAAHHPPVDHRRRRVGLLPGETADLGRDEVEVRQQPLGRSVLVRPVRHVGIGVERQLQPVGVVAPLALVAVGKLGDLKSAAVAAFASSAAV